MYEISQLKKKDSPSNFFMPRLSSHAFFLLHIVWRILSLSLHNKASPVCERVLIESVDKYSAAKCVFLILQVMANVFSCWKLHSSDHLPQHFGATTFDSSNKRNHIDSSYYTVVKPGCLVRKFAEKLILFVCPKLIINNLLSVIYWIKIIPLW